MTHMQRAARDALADFLAGRPWPPDLDREHPAYQREYERCRHAAAEGASPGTDIGQGAEAPKTDDSMSVFHVNTDADQKVIATQLRRRLAGYSAASKKAQASRKRMAEARTRAEYEEAASEHRAALEKTER